MVQIENIYFFFKKSPPTGNIKKEKKRKHVDFNKAPVKTHKTSVQNPFLDLSILKFVRSKITWDVNPVMHRTDCEAGNEKTTLSLPDKDASKPN